MRDYQRECIETIKDEFTRRNRQLVQLPTGSGKTWIFSKYLRECSDKFLVICPSVELKQQIIKTLKFFDIDNVKDDLKSKGENYVITSKSLYYKNNIKLINQYGFSDIVIDEAHHAQAPTYLNFINSLENPCRILGLTATPERSDNKNLLEIFEVLSYKKNIFEMIQDGFLADISAFKIKTGHSISKRSNDFRQIELKKLDTETRNNLIIKSFLENCKDMKTLIFCLSVEHSIKIAQMLQENGISAKAVYGTLEKRQREDALKKFKSGEIQVITNCQLLTEGFDEPSIEALIIARPTCSKSLYCQMVGRGLRKTDKKDICYLYELADNNHKICTFNVVCGTNPEFQRDYADGSTVLRLKKELDLINIEDITFEIIEHNLFLNEEPLKGNSLNILKSRYYEINAIESQIEFLRRKEIYFQDDISFLESAFLIWKHKLKRKYGFSH